VRVLLSAQDKTRDGHLHAFLVTSGVRLAEALGATWTAYDAQAGTLTLTRQLRRKPDGSFVLDELKTQGSVRTLRLNAQAREALENRRRQQAGEAVVSGLGLIFAAPTGQPMDGPAVTKRFHEHATEIGITSVRIHDLRHTFASMALANGVPVLEVSKALGHSKATVTLNTYGHSSDAGQKAMAAVMSNVFG